MFDTPRSSMGILVLLLILPQSIFVIGDYIAVGIRFPFFRLQVMLQSASGSGNVTQANPVFYSITIARELQYITRGIVGNVLGRTAVATYLWLAGLVILILSAVLVLSWQYFGYDDHARYPGPLIVLTGMLFLISAMVQYGPLLSGPSGYSVPVGIPLLWYCGYQFLQAAKGVAGDHKGDQDPGE
jgi:hypothetical protein